MSILICPRCQGTMESGFIVDHTHGGFAPPEWVEGSPERSFWVGVKMSGKKRLPVETFRCERCGYLESYARSQ